MIYKYYFSFYLIKSFIISSHKSFKKNYKTYIYNLPYLIKYGLNENQKYYQPLNCNYD